jgi:hypothetical protein
MQSALAFDADQPLDTIKSSNAELIVFTDM